MKGALRGHSQFIVVLLKIYDGEHCLQIFLSESHTPGKLHDTQDPIESMYGV